jgi:DNA-directed RNA polymerase specialized sigma subunit
MVRQYSKKTEIKEDDDLRSYVNQGLLDGIRKFDPKRGSKFIYFAHMDEENIFLGGVIQVY